MTIASQIGHYSFIAHCNIDEFRDRLRYALDGLDRLSKEGGWIGSKSLEAMQMKSDALLLRDIADDLMKRRAALLDNQPQPYKQAAE
jgi:hypothetical protein